MPKDNPKWGRVHYNALAKDLRETWEQPMPNDSELVKALVRGNMQALSMVVLKLAHRFMADNPNFDAMGFINAAVPDWAQKDIMERFGS